MGVEVLALTAFTLLVGAVSFWLWKQRRMAEEQARMNAELAEIGRGIRGLAHDLNHAFEAILAELERVHGAPDPEVRAIVGGVEEAARGAAGLVRAIRGDPPRAVDAPASAEGVVRLGAILLGGSGVPIDLDVDGAPTYLGSDADAMRVVQNLLSNAVRETARIADGRVRVEARDDALCVTNPVIDPGRLDQRIWQDGVSGSGSTGMGLAIAREAAARVGWTVRHEVRGREVTFVVEVGGSTRTPAPGPTGLLRDPGLSRG